MARAKRDTGGRFLTGVSGNPAGRPKGTPNRSTAEVKALLQSGVDWPKVFSTLEREAVAGSVPAARLLLAYAYGAPRGIPGDFWSDDPQPVVFVDDVPPPQRIAV